MLGKVAHYGTPIMDDLQTHGLPVGRDTLLASLDSDDVKFFLKQQQKCLADSQGSKEESTNSNSSMICIASDSTGPRCSSAEL